VRLANWSTDRRVAAWFDHDLPGGKKCLARRQEALHSTVVLGHSWRAKYGNFSRAPKHEHAKAFLKAMTANLEKMERALERLKTNKQSNDHTTQ
jgi:hypothetical protein